MWVLQEVFYSSTSYTLHSEIVLWSLKMYKIIKVKVDTGEQLKFFSIIEYLVYPRNVHKNFIYVILFNLCNNHIDQLPFLFFHYGWRQWGPNELGKISNV